MTRHVILAVVEVEVSDPRHGFPGITSDGKDEHGDLVWRSCTAEDWVSSWLDEKLGPEGDDYQNVFGAEAKVIVTKEITP